MGKYNWPDIARCNDLSDPTSEEIYRRIQAMANSGAGIGTLSELGIELLKVEGEPETRIVLSQESTKKLDNNQQPCYHIDMTQSNEIFSHADRPVDAAYLQEVEQRFAGVNPKFEFDDGEGGQVQYKPEVLRALRETALQQGIPELQFSTNETHEPVEPPTTPVPPAKFSHAKKHKAIKTAKSGVDQTAQFNDGRSISRTD